MNSFELTALALQIERLRENVEAAWLLAPNGDVSANLNRAKDALRAAARAVDPYIGRAVVDEARGDESA